MSSPFLRKTRKWRDERSACSTRAFVCREGSHVDALGPYRQPVDHFEEAARISLRVPDALRLG